MYIYIYIYIFVAIVQLGLYTMLRTLLLGRGLYIVLCTKQVVDGGLGLLRQKTEA